MPSSQVPRNSHGNPQGGAGIGSQRPNVPTNPPTSRSDRQAQRARDIAVEHRQANLVRPDGTRIALPIRHPPVAYKTSDTTSSSMGHSSLWRQLEESSPICQYSRKCISAKLVTAFLTSTAYGLTNNGILITGYPVIGSQHKVQSSGSCLDSPTDASITACAWDPNIKGEFFHQTTFSVALSSANSFIKDVQSLVKLKPKALCGVERYNGILMRYVTALSAYLGKEGDAIDFDITYYRSKDPLTPRLYEDIFEEIEQLAMFKYGALPHWGKNRNVAFEGVLNKYKNGQKFLKVKNSYDPLGLFSSEWTDQVLGLKDGISIVKEGCAMEGLCRCTEDAHCAPSEDYYCRPGKVYSDARVCTCLKSKDDNFLKKIVDAVTDKIHDELNEEIHDEL
ncbi:probable truncated L-gulonolactone oxidase 7, mitochondrial [Humulus lupulus]|uniref:probable truncated L-gulonolactone oxidase 7, mitochondrial n=1 Tax=Humulus lupulus TaxID=3486 RepID=UPI002B409A1D|nr:probable truncated L-gulonolactone oxidase 7, mitochondrial [Humulus lupulus]